MTFPAPVEVEKVFEWAREYDIEVTELVRTFPADEGGGINYNIEGAGMSESELAADWRLEIAAMTGSSAYPWLRDRRRKYASRTFLSLVETVFLRGSSRALAEAKAHPPGAA